MVQSDDEGKGEGRKKKPITEKIKEKLPGHKTEEHVTQQEPGYATQTATHHEPEKKGIIEKIKEKLPGHN